MKKENGFTLVELLAVVVILGLLLTLAVPAVSSYITSSKKGSFISSAKLFINQARSKVLTEKTFPREKNEKVTIPIEDLNMEKDATKSSYGNSWVYEKSYIVIENIGTNMKPKYSYSVALEDKKGYCINLTLEDDLEPSEVKKNGCSITGIPSGATIKLEKLVTTNTSELMTDEGGNIHYYGRTPNNYVTFNGETAGWRILGVYNIDGEKRIKLVRNTFIGSYSWDNEDGSSEYSRDWKNARIMKLLNPGYEDETTGGSLYWNRDSGNCYTGLNDTVTACNFGSIGLTDEAKTMIAKSTFYIGGYYTVEYKANQLVEKEKTKTWEGYVGLMTASDYGYASDLSSCKENLSNYGVGFCKSTNYLFGNKEWLLPYSTGVVSHAYVCSSGYVYDERVNESYGIRPVVYLNSNVKFIGNGNGSKETPFELSL